MAALLHGAQHRKDYQLWIYIGCAERLSRADKKNITKSSTQKGKILKLRYREIGRFVKTTFPTVSQPTTWFF